MRGFLLGLGIALAGTAGAAPPAGPSDSAPPAAGPDDTAPASRREPSTLAQDYALQCRGCHGADGTGVPGQVPSLRGVGVLLETPEGRARLLSVPGVRQASLSDARLAALLAWVAEVFAGPGESRSFPPLSAEEVGRYRGTIRTLR